VKKKIDKIRVPKFECGLAQGRETKIVESNYLRCDSVVGSSLRYLGRVHPSRHSRGRRAIDRRLGGEEA
jgi:hypothetical protein